MPAAAAPPPPRVRSLPLEGSQPEALAQKRPGEVVRSLPLEGSQHADLSPLGDMGELFAHYPWRDRNDNTVSRGSAPEHMFAHYPWRDRNTSTPRGISRTPWFAHYPWRDRNTRPLHRTGAFITPFAHYPWRDRNYSPATRHPCTTGSLITPGGIATTPSCGSSRSR